MLVLSRKPDQEIRINCHGKIISIKVVDIRDGNRVRIGLEADRDVVIHRKEIWDLIERQRAAQAPIQSVNPEVQPNTPTEA